MKNEQITFNTIYLKLKPQKSKTSEVDECVTKPQVDGFNLN